jgi:RNA polymerase sigma factor (sigma-70 family)
MTTTQELIDAATQGDERALVQLLTLCQPDLRRYARRTCAAEDIEEVVQDALIILYRRLGTLRSIVTFSGWLFKIIKRACLRKLRRRSLASLDENTALLPHDPTDIELRHDLARSIMALPKIYRDVVILRDVNELSAEETAIEVGASVEAVKSRLHRGRYLVRQQFA